MNDHCLAGLRRRVGGHLDAAHPVTLAVAARVRTNCDVEPVPL
jgi:hypothetical protein